MFCAAERRSVARAHPESSARECLSLALHHHGPWGEFVFKGKRKLRVSHCGETLRGRRHKKPKSGKYHFFRSQPTLKKTQKVGFPTGFPGNLKHCNGTREKIKMPNAAKRTRTLATSQKTNGSRIRNVFGHRGSSFIRQGPVSMSRNHVLRLARRRRRRAAASRETGDASSRESSEHAGVAASQRWQHKRQPQLRAIYISATGENQNAQCCKAHTHDLPLLEAVFVTCSGIKAPCRCHETTCCASREQSSGG